MEWRIASPLGPHEKAIPERAIGPGQSEFTFLLTGQHLFPDVSLCKLCSLCLFTCKASLHVAQQMPSTALQSDRDRLCLWESHNCNLAMLAPKSEFEAHCKSHPLGAQMMQRISVFLTMVTAVDMETVVLAYIHNYCPSLRLAECWKYLSAQQKCWKYLSAQQQCWKYLSAQHPFLPSLGNAPRLSSEKSSGLNIQTSCFGYHLSKLSMWPIPGKTESQEYVTKLIWVYAYQVQILLERSGKWQGFAWCCQLME